MEPASAAPLAMSPGVALFGGLTAVVGVLGVVAVLAGRVRPMTLALGFAGVAVQWALTYVAMTGVGQWAGEALFGLTVLVPAVVGWTSARWAADRSGPVAAGLVGGFVNLLVIGSVIQGKDAKAALSEAALWTAGLLVGSALLAAAGGAIGRRRPKCDTLPEPVCLFAIVTCATIFLLLITGGLVTGLEAGLAVPDWPNSFGHNMLLYPVSEMKEGRYYEHAHRLFGMLVGLSSFTLAALCWRHERRASIRWAASALLFMVCVQGLMGGLRVTGMFTLSQDPSMLAPSTLLAIAHGIFGQVVFATAAWIAAATSAAWRSPADLACRSGPRRHTPVDRHGARGAAVPAPPRGCVPAPPGLAYRTGRGHPSSRLGHARAPRVLLGRADRGVDRGKPDVGRGSRRAPPARSVRFGHGRDRGGAGRPWAGRAGRRAHATRPGHTGLGTALDHRPSGDRCAAADGRGAGRGLEPPPAARRRSAAHSDVREGLIASSSASTA